MVCANGGVYYDLMVKFICLHFKLPQYHHYADLSEGIELLKSLSGTFCLKCVSKIKSILSIIFHAIFGAVHIHLINFSYDDCENTSTLSYYCHYIGSMTHLPLCRIRVMKQWNALYVFLYSYKYVILPVKEFPS